MNNSTSNFDGLDKARPNCAVFGIYGHPQASIMTYYGLHAQQHRGQEAAGITSFFNDEKTGKRRFAYTRNQGLVLDVFSDPDSLTNVLVGDAAVGHNRYSTTGASSKLNIQPFNMQYHSGILSLAHNGNLVNTKTLRKQLQAEGAIFQTSTDSELFMHLIARSKEADTVSRVKDALRQARGAYSLAMLFDEGMIAACDPQGVRPLNLGRKKLEDGKYSYVVSSETCAFDIINAEYIRPIENNEIVLIDDETLETGKVKSFKIIDGNPKPAHCIFEYIYFARPDSKVFGHNVDKVRRKLGKNLAIESPEYDEYDNIRAMGVPDSGNTAALGYARVNNKQGNPSVYEIGLLRSHYVGRTFIAPGQDNRAFKVKTKFNPVKGVIEGRNVVLIDDSVVRGTTAKILLKMIRDAAKPKKLHLKITSPRIKYPCFYGMDFPSKEELIANHHDSVADIADALGADSLHYLSEEMLMASMPKNRDNSVMDFCTACFTGKYPIPIDK